MKKYRIIKSSRDFLGRKYHNFKIGEEVYSTGKNCFSNGDLQQFLDPDEYELIEEEK